MWLQENDGASLVDIGDGVLCLEFHSAGELAGREQARMSRAAIEESARNFEAMVVANDGDCLQQRRQPGAGSAGRARDGRWDDLNAIVERMQQANMAMKYAPEAGGGGSVFERPSAPAARWRCTAARVQASAELYLGFAEAAAGLIPAGGGRKRLLLRLGGARRAFELIGAARLSTSAVNARELGLLRDADGISMNPERLIGDAKALALALARSYRQTRPAVDIPAGGEALFAALKLSAWLERQAGRISDHDFAVAEKLAHVLCGGRLPGSQTVSEQYLLDLEREAFLSLCGSPKTQERLEHLLKTGKPLRN